MKILAKQQSIWKMVVGFASPRCRVLMACRDLDKAEAAAVEIRQETQGVDGVGAIVVVQLDLSSFSSVRLCASRLLHTESQINLLINNAGVMMCPKALTEDGFERQFATNHLGHFLLTLLLLPRILKSTPARIINVSSLAHEGGSIRFNDINWNKSYSETRAYAQSKLANVLFTKELAKRLTGRGVTVYALHPGTVQTELGRHVGTAFCWCADWTLNNCMGCFLKSPAQGAQTTIHCAIDEKAGRETGLYYADAAVSRCSSKARDPALALRLWEESIKWVKLEDFDPFQEEAGAAGSQPIVVQPKKSG